ncbi:MAG TPA: hypothetical protein VF274_06410 [Alphaproteobacteria bacterium]
MVEAAAYLLTGDECYWVGLDTEPPTLLMTLARHAGEGDGDHAGLRRARRLVAAWNMTRTIALDDLEFYARGLTP